MKQKNYPFSCYLSGDENDQATWKLRVFDKNGNVSDRLLKATYDALTIGFCGFFYNGNDRNIVLDRIIKLRIPGLVEKVFTAGPVTVDPAGQGTFEIGDGSKAGEFIPKKETVSKNSPGDPDDDGDQDEDIDTGELEIDDKNVKKNFDHVDLTKHCGTCVDDDQYFGAKVSAPLSVPMPHQGANVSRIVAIGSGNMEVRPAVFKPGEGEKPDLVDWVGGPMYRRGEAVYLLDRELAPDENRYLVPVTYIDEVGGQEGSVQHYVRGKKNKKPVPQYDQKWIEQAGVLDYVAGQVDRIHKNWLTHPEDERRPILIDNDLSFPNHPEKIRSDWVTEIAGKELGDEILESLYLVIGNRDLWEDLKEVVKDDKAVDSAFTRANEVYENKMVPASAAHVADPDGGSKVSEDSAISEPTPDMNKDGGGGGAVGGAIAGPVGDAGGHAGIVAGDVPGVHLIDQDEESSSSKSKEFEKAEFFSNLIKLKIGRKLKSEIVKRVDDCSGDFLAKVKEACEETVKYFNDGKSNNTLHGKELTDARVLAVMAQEWLDINKFNEDKERKELEELKKDFDESKHPRGGHQENKGEFSEAPGGGGSTETEVAEQPAKKPLEPIGDEKKQRYEFEPEREGTYETERAQEKKQADEEKKQAEEVARWKGIEEGNDPGPKVPESAYAGSLFDLEPYTLKRDDDEAYLGTMPMERLAHNLCGTDPVSGMKVVLTKLDKYDSDNEDDSDGYMSMEAHIIDTKTGEKAGDIHVKYEDSEAELSLCDIDEKHQGNGFATRWLEHFEETMSDNGAYKINLQANIDVGGYTWARLGYDFDSRGDLDTFRLRVYDYYTSIYKKKMKTEQLDALNHAWDIACLTGPDGRKVGKEYMLGKNWYGHKTTPDYQYIEEEDNEDGDGESGWEIGKEYYAVHKQMAQMKQGRGA